MEYFLEVLLTDFFSFFKVTRLSPFFFSSKQNHTELMWEIDESEPYLFEAGVVSAETSIS